MTSALNFIVMQVRKINCDSLEGKQRLSPGQTMVTFQRNISLHCWPSIYKPRPDDRSTATQHITVLLGATCYVRLATLLRRVATFWVLQIELVHMPRRNIVARTWPNEYNVMQHPQMSHEKFDHFQICAKNTQHVATSHNRVAKHTQHVAPNSVAICCVEMLGSFSRDLSRSLRFSDLCNCLNPRLNFYEI